MLAQYLYDFREEFELCGGDDLANFFYQQTGNPSPSGNVRVDADAAMEFIVKSLRYMKANGVSIP
jgi:hypothetical protein